MNECDISTDERNISSTISTAGATVRSDDFQLCQSTLQRHDNDTVADTSRVQQTDKRFSNDEETCGEQIKATPDNDSRVPSVSSRASIPSTSSCKSSTAGLDDQEKPQQSIDNTNWCDEDDESAQQLARRKVLWKRRRREAERIAWERRCAARSSWL